MNITITDDKWPKLTMVVNRETVTGDKFVSTDSYQYDLSYTNFEGILHNHLRPMVEELIKRRKRNQQGATHS
jgi:hypothetical protein